MLFRFWEHENVLASVHMLSMRPWALSVVLGQFILALLSFFVVADVFETIIMALITGLGFAGWWREMQFEYIFFWGLTCLMTGFINVVRLAEWAISSSQPLFSTAKPILYNIQDLIDLLCLIALLAGAYIAHCIHVKCQEQMQTHPENNERQPLSGAPEDFATFMGYGQRLGGPSPDPEANSAITPRSIHWRGCVLHEILVRTTNASFLKACEFAAHR